MSKKLGKMFFYGLYFDHDKSRAQFDCALKFCDEVASVDRVQLLLPVQR